MYLMLCYTKGNTFIKNFNLHEQFHQTEDPYC